MCGMLAGADLSRAWPHDRTHFLARARWKADDLGLAVARLVVALRWWRCWFPAEPVHRPSADGAKNLSDMGAGERIRTAGLPFTRSPAQRSERTTCTDTTDWCRDGTHFTWFHK